MKSELASVNRMAVTVLPEVGYLEWTKTCPIPNPNTTLESLQREATVYLLPQTDSNMEKHLQRHYKSIFIEELFAWCTNETYWPKDLSYRNFQKFFKVKLASIVFDLAKGALVKEEEQ